MVEALQVGMGEGVRSGGRVQRVDGRHQLGDQHGVSVRGGGELHVHDRGPKVDNPFVFNELPWPWYVLPLHAAAVLHLIVINVVYRLTLPVRRDDETPCTREVPAGERMPVWL